MPVLTDAQRQDVWRNFQDLIGKRDRSLSISKAELLIAIDQGDDWIEANFAGALTSITGNPSTELTTDEKLEMLYLIVLRRNQRIPV